MKVQVEITEDNILDLLESLPPEVRTKAMECFVFQEISVEMRNQIEGKNFDFNAWSTTGWRSGSEIREYL